MSGRPEFQPSAFERTQVRMLKICGYSDAKIAVPLGLSLATLRKHFEAELSAIPLKNGGDFVLMSENELLANMQRIALSDGMAAYEATRWLLEKEKS